MSISKRILFSAVLPRPGILKMQTVTFRSGPEKVIGFLVSTHESGRQRAVIAIHEWWGLNDWVKGQATNLAANGYTVLAVDLYRGKVTENPVEARRLKRSLRKDRAIRVLKAAFDYLTRQPDVDPGRICSIGWSMGGGLVLQLAIHEPRLAACVVNYGSLPTEPADIQKINARVLGIFGSLDRGIPPDQVRAFEKSMRTVKKQIDIKIYDGAAHAFENPANKSGYRPEATDDAWLRTLTFLDQATKSKSPAP
ncbi:MAG: dienelactone hydrolase family protein [Candidatus Acidiferrales bacterium]